MRLYHFTCEHLARRITRRGMLMPAVQPMLFGVRLVWLTDLAEPDVEGLGLTRTLLHCDRTEVRYVVDTERAMPWSRFVAIAEIAPATQAALEEGRKPEHWWVATSAVLGERDRGWQLAGGRGAEGAPAPQVAPNSEATP